MFSKLKALSGFNKKAAAVVDVSAIKDSLCSGLFNVMERSFNSRKSDARNSKFSSSDIDQIVEAYAKKNALLAAASSIVPGPFGVLGSIPELLLNFGNQMNMIYDLGCAYGKEEFINKDVLLDIPFAVFGGNTDLSLLQNQDADLMDSSKALLMNKVSQLSESVIEKTLKKSIVQFIPIGGPILMGTWAKMTTSKISKTSMKFLDQQEVYVEHFKKEETEEVKKALQIEKIKGLANLIESNNEINEDQIAFIGPIIENSDLSNEKKKYFLEESMKNGSNFELNYQLLQDYEEDESLIMELVIMAKRSGRIDELEKAYIHSVGRGLHLEASFIEDLF